MGFDRRPIPLNETLKLCGITIMAEGGGIVVNMTVDGGAELARNMRNGKKGYVADWFLEELIRVGRQARRDANRLEGVSGM